MPFGHFGNEVKKILNENHSLDKMGQKTVSRILKEAEFNEDFVITSFPIFAGMILSKLFNKEHGAFDFVQLGNNVFKDIPLKNKTDLGVITKENIKIEIVDQRVKIDRSGNMELVLPVCMRAQKQEKYEDLSDNVTVVRVLAVIGKVDSPEEILEKFRRIAKNEQANSI